MIHLRSIHRVVKAHRAVAWAVVVLLSLHARTVGQQPDDSATRLYTAKDTLRIGQESNAAAKLMLEQVAWDPAEFRVSVSPPEGIPADHMVRFASPHPTGDEVNDTVTVEWHRAKDAEGRYVVGPAPSMVVLHILDGRMLIARAISRGLSERGIHCFVMHMPHYGLRRAPGFRPTASTFLSRTQQAVADARRTRDAIAALPGVDAKRIGIQGTSLGGFIASAAIGLDDAFSPAFLFLSGGDLHGMFMTGRREAELVRAILEADGYTGEKLKELCARVEPTTLAHRVDPSHTYLFSARMDQVVPPRNAEVLAKSLRLPEDHHIWLQADHYTGVIYLPWCIQFMAERINGK